MSDVPKLYTNKPKKGQLKQKAKDFCTPAPNPSAIGSTPPPPPTPPPPKESFARRYKFLWPMLLTVNLAIGVYIFMRAKKKDSGGETDQNAGETTAPVSSTPVITPEKTMRVLPPMPEPLKISQPIPENEQRELFKWMLEEKRKVKPSDLSEKKRIDEEKAVLKQFLRAKSIPTF